MNQTFSRLSEGTPPSGNIHRTGFVIGYLDGTSLASTGTDLALAHANAEWRYLMFAGTVGWSTTRTLGAGVIYTTFAESLWYANNLFLPKIETNVRKRQVIDLASATPRHAREVFSMPD